MALLVGLAGTGRVAADPTAHPDAGLQVELGAVVVNSETPGDPTMEAFLQPYRRKLEATMNERVGQVSIPLLRSRPESTLGNVLADGIRWATEARLRRKLDICVLNAMGIRADLPRGRITRGEILEVIPFENYLVILSLTGRQVLELAGQMVASGGEPVSGLRIFFRDDGIVTGVRVGGKPLQPDTSYLVLTIDYLAFGQGPMPALHQASKLEETGLHYRDMFFEYLAALDSENRNLPSRLEPRYRKLP